MNITKVSLVFLAVLCASLSAQAQTTPLHLKVVGDVEANKALKIL
jgi:hypothetical protein